MSVEPVIKAEWVEEEWNESGKHARGQNTANPADVPELV